MSYSNDVTMEYSSKVEVLLISQGLPLAIGLAATLIGYAKVIKNLRELPNELLSEMNIKACNFLWYPAVLFFAFVPALADNIINIQSDGGKWYIKAIHIIFTHSIGLTNAIVYGLQRRIHQSKDDNYNSDKNVHLNNYIERSSISDQSFY